MADANIPKNKTLKMHLLELTSMLVKLKRTRLPISNIAYNTTLDQTLMASIKKCENNESLVAAMDYPLCESSMVHGVMGLKAYMLNLLYVTMKALLNERISDRLIRTIFQLKAMVINGEYPSLFACTVCGNTDHLTHTSDRNTGCVCQKCAPSVRDAHSISSTALYTLQYIVSSPIDRLYTFTVNPEVEQETARWMDRYIDRNTDKKFKSLEILELMI